MNKSLCPCGSKLKSAECCQRFINGSMFATTPEELMRSRYTAYAHANIAYIARTMKSPAIDDFDPVDARIWARSVKWLRLEVLSSSVVGAEGYVEFRVYYTHQNRTHVMHERSTFHLEAGQWYYVDGNPVTPT